MLAKTSSIAAGDRMNTGLTNAKTDRVSKRIYLASIVALLLTTQESRAQTLVALEHHVIGAKLEVSPPELFIPKTIPGSLSVNITTTDGTRRRELEHLADGTHVEGVLRGPAFPAYRLLGIPNEPLRLPPIALPGEYQIDDLRLVNTETNEILMMATPSRVAVHVFPEVLVARVESRPLSLDEIRERGIVIDASSFTAVEFEAAFVIEGRTLPVRFPVVTPVFRESTEIIPRAELEARLVRAEEINRGLTHTLTLPRELDLPGLHLQVEGFNFQRTGGFEEEGDRIVPPIPGLVVVPGHVGFLNQFFSVMVFAANASPRGSNLTVHSLRAELELPPGRDHSPATGDEPLAFARIGSPAQIQTSVAMTAPGSDGELGTGDDQGRIGPGQTAQGELLLKGIHEGLHVFDVKLSGILDGFADGEVAIEGRAAGSVLVRNARFSVAFSHPQTIRDGEAYTAALTVLNTSDVRAELVSVTLRRSSLSGTTFADENQAETIELGTLEPGEAKIAEYRMRAEQTGSVTFTNLTGESISGRIDLVLGVDERGVALDAHTIGYPRWVDALPSALRRAADRVLGQALSVSTAAILPAGVRSISPKLVEQRVIELAEAGQRLRYGDAPSRVYVDLLLDYYGGRAESAGFAQILRETAAGAAFEQALYASLSSAGTIAGPAWIAERGADIAGRGEAWTILASDHAEIGLEIGRVRGATIAVALGDRHEELIFRVPPSTSGNISWAMFDGLGAGRRVQIAVSSQSSEVCYHVFPSIAFGSAAIDPGCENISSGSATGTPQSIAEADPVLMSAQQDLEPIAGRPARSCSGPTFGPPSAPIPYGNYGTLVAALFSKPMSVSAVERNNAFVLDNDVGATGVRIQPGGRVVLINFRNALGERVPRSLLTSGITDVHDNRLEDAEEPMPIALAADRGVSIRGRVIGTDGAPVGHVPVTLIMHDEEARSHGCVPVDVRVSQTRTSTDGSFALDFVMAGLRLGYTLAATDTRRLNQDAINFLLEASPEGELDPGELERLATQPDTIAAFTAMFGGRDVHGSIAAAEGVDRATFHDAIDLSSPRIDSTVPVALRFRGRGTVFGIVYRSDGATPYADAAVNLFPDRGSRELGRGVRAGANGQFVFAGVPLGAFSIDARTGDGLARIVADRLDEPGEEKQVDVVLSAAIVPRGILEGTVYEADGRTPHAGATVGVRDNVGNVQAVVIADGEGFFRATSIAAGLTSIDAISADGRRAGRRPGISVQANTTTFASVMLPGTAEVIGRVLFANGSAAAGALVAGGESIVTANSSGEFVLSGVPVGASKIAAGLRSGNIVRFGGAVIDVLPDVTNSVIIRLESRGSIAGEVLGVSAPVRVAIPLGQGFYWTTSDADGHYRFDNLPIRSYVVSAPAPGVVDTSAAIAAISTEDEAEIAAALGEVFSLYTSGFNAAYQPGTYGFVRATLNHDGHVIENADIAYLPEGTVSGRVRNEHGIAISARVTLFGLVPESDGAPGFGRVAEVMSDPATGVFSISGLRVGRYTVSAATPFYPTPISFSGETTLTAPHAANVELQFGAQPTGGRLFGLVTRDGQPAGGGVDVSLSFANYAIETSTHSTFLTRELPAGNYTIELFDSPPSNRVGIGSALITPGNVTPIELSLLANTGALAVTVLQGNGEPANAAKLVVAHAAIRRSRYTPTTDEQGFELLSGLDEGRYSVTACWGIAQSRLCTTETVEVPPSPAASLTIHLRGTGTISGVFVEADGTTPVGFAQIAIGEVAYATTDAFGQFSVEGIPLGIYRLVGRNAVTGRAAATTANVAHVGQNVNVTLREDPLGEVIGRVIGSDGASIVPGAHVALAPSSVLFPATIVTADPVGAFRVPGVPPGAFSIAANDPIDLSLRGSITGEMPAIGGTVELDVPLAPRANLDVYVQNPSGTPARATVTIGAQTIDTHTGTGLARFTGLPLGAYEVGARSLDQSRSTVLGTAVLAHAGDAPPLTLTLSGVGSVEVQLVNQSTVAVSAGAEVALEMIDALRVHHTATGFPDTNGRFVFQNVPLGAVRARGVLDDLAATENGTLSTPGQQISLLLRLGPSATVTGRLMRADGVSELPFVELVLSYRSQLGVQSAATTRTSSTGVFTFEGVPHGPATLRGEVPLHDGIVFREPTIAGEVFDFGDVLLDEERPSVINVLPADGATNVDVHTHLFVTFSEVMDTDFDDARAAYLTDGIDRHPLQISWSLGNTLVLIPTSSLASERAYTLVIGARDVIAPNGQVAHGPVDLANRAMASPLITSFTTRDAVPPTFVLAPGPGVEQVDPSAVVRVQFSEPIVPSSVRLLLLGPNNFVVPGALSFALNHHVAVFTPTDALALATTYTATLTAARDRAGNMAVGLEPSGVAHVFTTLDTQGPELADLLVQAPLIAGSVVTFEADLEDDEETGVQIELTPDRTSYVWSQPGSVFVPFRLPVAAGSLHLSARAIDRFGNFGNYFEKDFTVVANQLPEVEIERVTPSSGPLLTDAPFVFRVVASDPGGGAIVRVAGAVTGDEVSTPPQQSSTSPLLITGFVPRSIGPGQSAEINVEAEDNSGAIVHASLSLDIADGAEPELVVTGPVASVDTGVIAVFDVDATDEFGVRVIQLEATGAITWTASVAFTPAPGTVEHSFERLIPEDLVHGATIQLRITATDQAGNVNFIDRTLTVQDRTRPTVEVSPQGLEVVTNTQIEATFSEPVENVTEDSFYLESGSVRISAQVVHVDGETSAELLPASELQPDTTYTLYLTSDIRDLHDNALFPSVTTFRTAAAESPTNRTPALGYANSQNRGLRFETSVQDMSLSLPHRLAVPLTLEFWISALQPTSTATILSSTTTPGLSVEYSSSGFFSFGLNTVGQGYGVYTSSVSAAPALTLNNPPAEHWHHVALSYDGTSFRAYVNGILAVDEERSGAIDYAGGNLRFAGFNGNLDDVRLWDVARSRQAIRATMHLAVSGAEPDLYAYWPLDQVTLQQPNIRITPNIASRTTAAALLATQQQTPTVQSPLLAIGALSMTSRERTFGLVAIDLDSQPLSIVIDTLPEHGRLYLSSGAEITSASLPSEHSGASLSLRYVMDADYFGPDELTAHANDGMTNSRTLAIELEIRPLKDWIGGSSSWSTSASWSPPGAPTADDAVRIPAGVQDPIVLSASTQVEMLSIGPGSTIEIASGATLLVDAWTDNRGAIQGAGTLRVQNSSLQGSVPNLWAVFTTLEGGLDVAGDLTIDPSGVLDVGAHTVTITGSLIATDLFGFPGFVFGLLMEEPTARVDVAGDVTLECTTAPGNIFTAGQLRIGGDLNVIPNSSSQPCFAAAAGHRTLFDGGLSQIAVPAANVDHFGALEIELGADVALNPGPAPAPATASEVVIRGTLRSGGQLTIGQDLIMFSGASLVNPDPSDIDVLGTCYLDPAATVEEPSNLTCQN